MSGTFEPRTAVVEIFTGDYLDRIRQLEREAEAAKDEADDAGPRLNSDGALWLEKAREHDALVREAHDHAIQVRVKALPRKAWKALCAEHPPRKAGGDVSEAQARSDALSGVNDDTFKDALVAASIIEPTLTADELDELADVDFDRIYLTAFGLNRGTVGDPKASLVSRLSQTNDETSS